MKNALKLIFVLSAALLTTNSCKKDEAAVTGIELSFQSLTISIDETKEITAKVLPENAEDKTIKWSSSNTSVATVEAGLVRAIAAGDAVITAKAKSSDVSATCKVTVKPLLVESITLDRTSIVMEKYEETTLSANALPAKATNKEVVWSSSNDKIVTVEKGKLKAVDYGEAIITAASADGNTRTECKVVVFCHVDGIFFDQYSFNVYVGQKFTIQYIVSPENATNKNITWNSSDSEIATVDNKGEVTGLKEGRVEITATAEDGGVNARVRVNVDYKSPESIVFEKKFYETTPGQTFTILPILQPEYASFERVNWYSSDPSVATVDKTGKVTTLKSGFTVIKASGNYDIEDTYTLRVKRVDIPENAVDLGLPSCTLWGTLNIGATKPEEFGGFYAWGELTEKPTYYWDNYKFGMHNKLTKYGYYDPKQLEKEDDIANVTLGGTWYIPTSEEISELVKNTNSEWVENYLGTGIQGVLFKGKTEGYEQNSIFIPAGGRKGAGLHLEVNEKGYIWSSRNGEGYTQYDYEAVGMQFYRKNDQNKVSFGIGRNQRFQGFTVRPINRTE